MQFDEQYVAEKLRRWDHYVENYHLPEWQAIPDIGLYMEQLIALLKGYLDYLPPDLAEEQFITAATVNNYVRKKIMPEPRNKKYYRTHIAYLIIICTLKHSLSISTLQTIIPVDLTPQQLQQTYTSYIRQHKLAFTRFADQVRAFAAQVYQQPRPGQEDAARTEQLITTSAVISMLSRLLAEKLLLLEGKTPVPDPAPQKPE